MGQSMAEKQMFLFMVGMMKSFEIMPATSEALPDCGYNMGSNIGIIRGAPSYRVMLKSR